MVRPASLIKRFPEKRTATVTYPVIGGSLNSAVLRKVRSLLEVKNIFDSSLGDYRTEAWLTEFSFKVNYNQNYILDLTFSQNGSAAYPDSQTRHFAIDLRNGTTIKASDVFSADKRVALANLVNRKLQAELKAIVKSLAESKSHAEDIRIAQEAQEPLEFTVADLDNFSVGARGITFLYDAGYPHAIQAFEPNGSYFFSYSELRPFIKRESVLGQFVK
ncbi:MAG: hypothetical protein QOD33_1504 [Pyrinomonadaceae bacterium]|nr:hypothetical protein [Pyrinomonadaceae bacterium]